MRTSITTTSGFRLATAPSASSPSTASPDDLDVVDAREREAEAFAEERVLVDEQHPHAARRPDGFHARRLVQSDSSDSIADPSEPAAAADRRRAAASPPLRRSCRWRICWRTLSKARSSATSCSAPEATPFTS